MCKICSILKLFINSVGHLEVKCYNCYADLAQELLTKAPVQLLTNRGIKFTVTIYTFRLKLAKLAGMQYTSTL